MIAEQHPRTSYEQKRARVAALLPAMDHPRPRPPIIGVPARLALATAGTPRQDIDAMQSGAATTNADDVKMSQKSHPKRSRRVTSAARA